MERDPYGSTGVTGGSSVTNNTTLNVEYGYIIGMLNSENDGPLYRAAVARERTRNTASQDWHLLPFDQTVEELRSLYGDPQDLIGLRVRIEYYGTNWTLGRIRIVSPKGLETRSSGSEFNNRGFRYAVPGEGGG